jgi:hypothetical protein
MMTKRQKQLILASVRKRLDSETELEKIAQDCGKPYVLGKIREHLFVLSNGNDNGNDNGTFDYESIIIWCLIGIGRSLNSNKME